MKKASRGVVGTAGREAHRACKQMRREFGAHYDCESIVEDIALGYGIPRSQWDDVASAFERLDRSTKRKKRYLKGARFTRSVR